MRKRHGSIDLEAVAFSSRPHRTRKVSQAVGGKHRRLIERRDEKGAGQMREVVLDAMVLGANRLRAGITSSGELLVNAGKTPQCPEAIESETGHAHGINQLRPDTSPGITWNGDVLNLTYGHARLSQAVTDSMGWEAGRIFHAVESLLLYRAH